ncbi:glycosyltransferase [Shewanella inventionis]|uniref:Glycosyl transferase n=1 Tax=Shewanella inventionis TaxID=1738770 RepID=A0ABQ1JR49_9GAMM|nr:glycosyltransferase [Shewanella inventionis]MCL1159812.1 glycosyltransferase [Shewanella inventionis]GGB75179.1 glycosyl transferase [Shewanella inventionis]
MKVAVVHDWLTDLGGAEKVLKSIINIYPNADIYTIVCGMNNEQLSSLGILKPVNTSFIQRLPFGIKKYRSYLPLMPLAIQQFDLSSYDLIISSSYCVAKGVLTGPDQLHISYCHSPVRYAWDLQGQYLKESGIESGFKSILARYFLNKIRDFDVRSSFAVDKYVANSTFIQRRIMKFYRRESEVIYPPVDTESFTLVENRQNYYITCSRLVPYKKVDLIVNAFKSLPDRHLLVVGDGPDYKRIKESLPPNVTLLGFLEYSDLISKIQNAKAFIYAAEEDFGIVPVEAQACGTPVIGYGKGGLIDTVKNGITGIHFYKQTTASIIEAVKKFENSVTLVSAKEISQHAQKFGSERFENELSDFINEAIELHKSKLIQMVKG